MTAGSLALVWPLLSGAGPSAQRAVGFGAALAAVNTALAYFLARWSSRRSPNVFLGAVLGGMFGRIVVMLGAIALGVLALDLPRLPLAFSVLSYFTVFLIFELALLHRQTSRREVQG
jgi:branched-subunit amino acid ABC-type transport system permease component